MRCPCCNIYIPPEPVILLSCGSFNPITMLHLRIMEVARDKLERTWSISKTHWNKASEDGMLKPSNMLPNAKPMLVNISDSVCSNYETDDVIPRRQVVIGGVLSPVSDDYNKPNLAPAQLRVELARLACATSSDWLVVSPWESDQSHWSRTRVVVEQLQSVLDRVYSQIINSYEAPVPTDNGEDTKDLSTAYTPRTAKPGLFTESWLRNCMNSVGLPCSESSSSTDGVHAGQSVSDVCKTTSCPSIGSHSSTEIPNCCALYSKPRVKLVCGADLLESFAVPNLWAQEDIEVLVRDYGIVCVSRPGSDAAKFVFESDILRRYEDNIILATEWCKNNLSATLVRRALSSGRPVRYLVPEAALEKIYELGLYNAKRPSRMLVQVDSLDAERHRRGKHTGELDDSLHSEQM